MLLVFGLLLSGVGARSATPFGNAGAAAPPLFDGPQVCTERGSASLGAAALSDRVWKGRHSLRVRFLDGSEFLRGRVQHYAQIWSDNANIGFRFVEAEPSDIRISFTHDGSSWSYVGNAARNVDEDEPTMHFGWFDEGTADVKFRRTILHEFGHALGLIHEHQSPGAGINWNRAAVYQYYKAQFGWNKNAVDDDIFQKYAETRTQHTAYDPHSIMHYPIPAEFTNDGTSVGWNTDLSAADIALVKRLYP